jgi:hypothetical protein
VTRNAKMLKAVAFFTFFLFVLVPMWMLIHKLHELAPNRDN